MNGQRRPAQKAAGFNETLEKSLNHLKGLRPPAPAPMPAPNAARDAAFNRLMEIAKSRRDRVTKCGGKPLTIEQAFEQVMIDGAYASLARAALGKADGSVGQDSDRDPPKVADRSVPIDSLGPIQTGTGLPPEADLDPKDITPASAYERLLARVREYADKHGVSEAVAWPTVAQQHPELFAISKRTPHMDALAKRATLSRG